MTRPNIYKTRKVELAEAERWKCPHGHTGLEHWNCWLKYGKPHTKVGYLDIEASNLDADFGIMLSYFIKEEGKNKFYGRVVKPKEVVRKLDYDLVKECIEDLKKFDVVVTYYGTGFDLPFIRARSLYHKLPFLPYGILMHRDIYYIAKSKLKISSRRLANVARVILGKNEKTRVDGKYWLKALQGNKKSLGYIEDHNKKDCIVLEEVTKKLEEFSKGTRKSI